MKCNCGRAVRYTQIIDGNWVGSCNKRKVCDPYDLIDLELSINRRELGRYKRALIKIVESDGEGYEYKAWAKEALDKCKT